MAKKNKTISRFFFFIVTATLAAFSSKAGTTPYVLSPAKTFTDTASAKADLSFRLIDSRYNAALNRLKLQAESLKPFIAANNYNSQYCFLIDMSIPSGKKRFFVYNLKTNQVMESAMVTHGIGSKVNGSDENLKFSNDPSSLQTSLGRYKVGASYAGHFGLSYKLYGLDKTNSRAAERAIVIHSHSSIPTTECYPLPIGESFGCPSVAPSFLTTLTTYIKGSSQPIMMWIYN